MHFLGKRTTGSLFVLGNSIGGRPVCIGAHLSAAKRGLSKWVLWDLEDMS